MAYSYRNGRKLSYREITQWSRQMKAIKRQHRPSLRRLIREYRWALRYGRNELPTAFNERRDTNYFSKERIAVYTCITGGYDRLLEPLCAPDNVDYYAVTDFPVPEGSLWKRISAADYEICAGLSPAEQNRYFKMHPDVLFPDYDISVYVDGNLRIHTDFTEHANRMSELGFSTFRHALRNCVYDEIEACRVQHKASSESLDAYEELLRNEDFPKQYGLSVCSILVRRHNDSFVKNLMEQWWQEYISYVRRDQVVLPRILLRNGISFDQITTLGGNVHRDSSFGKEEHVKN